MPDSQVTNGHSGMKLTTADYFTKINAFEYKRTRPSDPLKIEPLFTLDLPLPVQFPSDHYSSSTSPYDLGIAGNALDTALNFGDSDVRDRIATAAVGVVGGAAIASALFGKIDSISKKSAVVLGFADVAAPYAGAYLGAVKNPKTALLFNGMNLRQIAYQFRLTPRNEGESADIQSALIILRQSMHPTYNKTFNSFALDYPMLFTVSYDDKTSKVMGYPKMDPSFLTDMQINNAAAGNAFFKNGLPAIIDLTLTFAEIDMKTRESFTGNYNKDMRSIDEFVTDKLRELKVGP